MTRNLMNLLLTLLIGLMPMALAAQGAPPGGKPLLPKPGIEMFPTGDLQEGLGVAEIVPVEGQPFRKAIRLTTLKAGAMKWNPQNDIMITVPTQAGDVMLLEFWMRAVKGQGESGDAKSEVVFERYGDPWTKAIEQSISAGPKWKKFMMPFVAREDLEAEKSHLSFRMGYGPQSYELADVKITNYGTKKKLSDMPQTKVTYGGMEEDAPWRKTAEENIEKVRKGDLTVTVKDKNGKPLSGAKVSVRMKRHAFGFGSAVVAGRMAGTGEDSDRYRAEIERLFSRVVFENDLKWGFWEQGATNSGGWSRKETLDAAKWLNDRNIEIRGHNMVWGGWKYMPGDVQQLKDKPKALEAAIEKRIMDVGGAMKGKLVEWDVVNEPVPEKALTDILGQDALVTWFKKAREADPKAVLFVNDYPNPDSMGHLDGCEAVIKFLQEKKAPVGGFGLQAHIGESPWSIPDLLQVIDRFGALGVPVAITEYDTQIKDEELEGQFTKDFMTAVFSNPHANSFITWGFWDGAHYGQKAPFFKRDWSLKPAGKAFEELVLKDWWTNADGKTDAAGSYQTRGFAGDYEVVVKSGSKSVTVKAQLSKDGLALPVVLK